MIIIYQDKISLKLKDGPEIKAYIRNENNIIILI